jgi:hypothetical protein
MDDRLEICEGCIWQNPDGWYKKTREAICKICRRAYSAGIAHQKAKQNAEVDAAKELAANLEKGGE